MLRKTRGGVALVVVRIRLLRPILLVIPTVIVVVLFLRRGLGEISCPLVTSEILFVFVFSLGRTRRRPLSP